MKLNVFRGTHRPSSGAQNCTSSLWFCIRERLLEVEVAGRCQIFNKMQQCIKIYYSVFIWSSTCFGGHRPSSGAQNCTSSLWFCIRKKLLDVEVAGRCQIANKMQQFIKIYYSVFIWRSTCFGRHTAHHQELITALGGSGFVQVKGCWTLRSLDAVK